MNSGFEAVKAAMALVIPTVLVTSNELFGVSQAINDTIKSTTLVSAVLYSAGPPIIPAVPALVKFLLTEKYKSKYDLIKYKGVINNWATIVIIAHEENADPLIGDTITCLQSNTPQPVWKDTDSYYEIATTISLSLENLIYTTWEYYPISNSLGNRLISMAEGMKIDFIVKTKDDNERLRIDSYVDTIIDKCYDGYLNFPIKDSSQIVIGNFKVLGRPYIIKNQSEGSNIQSRTVSITGYYAKKYKH